MKSIRLRPGKERSLLRRHPWVFEGSIDRGKADTGRRFASKAMTALSSRGPRTAPRR